MSGLNLRTALTQALTDGLPATWRVVAGPATLTRVDRPTVAVWTTELEHAGPAPAGHYLVTHTVQVFTPHQQPEKADDALDEHLGQILPVLWSLAGYTLTRAVREVGADGTLHAWSLTVTNPVSIMED